MIFKIFLAFITQKSKPVGFETGWHVYDKRNLDGLKIGGVQNYDCNLPKTANVYLSYMYEGNN